jgi:hypothetical protein
VVGVIRCVVCFIVIGVVDATASAWSSSFLVGTVLGGRPRRFFGGTPSGIVFGWLEPFDVATTAATTTGIIIGVVVVVVVVLGGRPLRFGGGGGCAPPPAPLDC